MLGCDVYVEWTPCDDSDSVEREGFDFEEVERACSTCHDTTVQPRCVRFPVGDVVARAENEMQVA